MYPEDYRYSKDHEWVARDGEELIVGITDFAQSELGDVVYVEAPEVGSTFDADDEVGTIESVKAVAEIYAPIGGEVVAVNEALVEAPEKVNEDPHGDGWIFRLRAESGEAFDALMTAEAYGAFIQQEEA